MRALTSATIAGLLRPLMADVNMVSAPAIAKDRGIKVSETKSDSTGAFDTYIRVTVETNNQTRSVAGTLFSNGQPRVISSKV